MTDIVMLCVIALFACIMVGIMFNLTIYFVVGIINKCFRHKQPIKKTKKVPIANNKPVRRRDMDAIKIGDLNIGV